MTFDFATAGQIHFGPDSLAVILKTCQNWGPNLYLVLGSRTEPARELCDQLTQAGKEVTVFQVTQEPNLEIVQAGIDVARQRACDGVIALGGGSVLDAAKVIAVMQRNRGDLMTYLEVIGEGAPLQQPGVPLIAAPTTAGTGAEVTRNAVLDVPEHQRKVSMRSPYLLPTLAVVDPTWTLSVPPILTAQTGLDALTQVIEPFVSPLANPLTDGFCREGIRRAARSLQRAVEQGQDLEARTDMALASLCGGLALANAKLGAVHGFAGPLGGFLHAPHGAICGALLPTVVQANVTALRQRQSAPPSLQRFDELGVLLTAQTDATAEDSVDWIQKLGRDLQVPSLGQLGLKPEHLPVMAEQARNSSSMKGNPAELTPEELIAILNAAL